MNGYYYPWRPSSTRPPGVYLDHMPSLETSFSVFLNKSGSHRPEGIFYGLGGRREPGKVISQAAIIDFAPTVFHLPGLPPPSQREGRVLIGDNGRGAVSKSDETISHTGAGHSRDEEEQIRERLRDLGYLG